MCQSAAFQNPSITPFCGYVGVAIAMSQKDSEQLRLDFHTITGKKMGSLDRSISTLTLSMYANVSFSFSVLIILSIILWKHAISHTKWKKDINLQVTLKIIFLHWCSPCTRPNSQSMLTKLNFENYAFLEIVLNPEIKKKPAGLNGFISSAKRL